MVRVWFELGVPRASMGSVVSWKEVSASNSAPHLPKSLTVPSVTARWAKWSLARTG